MTIFNQAGQQVGTQINVGGGMQESIMEILEKLATNFLVDEGERRPYCIHCKAEVKWLASKEIIHLFGCPIVSALRLLGR